MTTTNRLRTIGHNDHGHPYYRVTTYHDILPLDLPAVLAPPSAIRTDYATYRLGRCNGKDRHPIAWPRTVAARPNRCPYDGEWIANTTRLVRGTWTVFDALSMALYIRDEEERQVALF